MVHCWRTIVVQEGAQVLYSGLAPALLRQAIYGTIKYGLYYSIKDVLGGEESALKNISCAVVAGSISAAVANPTDVLKVRLQSQSAPVVNPKKALRPSVYACFHDMYIREGIHGLWRGVGPTAQRAGVVAGVQLPVYDWTKLFFEAKDIFPGESAVNHLLSSFAAGLCACLASSPIDVVRTRLMDQRRVRSNHPKARKKVSRIYTSSIECGLATVKNEGMLGLYKGFVPAFTRMGPWNIIFFLVYEQLKQL